MSLDKALSKKFESLDSEERDKVRQLMRERTKDASKDLSWIYKGDKPEKEEYLLGRKIDRHIEDEANAIGGGGTGGSSGGWNIMTSPGLTPDFEEALARRADIAMREKMREDPFYAIKQREEDAKKRLLQNPVKMKMLERKAAEKRRMKEIKKAKKKEKKKMKKKKKGKDSDSDDSGSEDDLLKKLMAIRASKADGASAEETKKKFGLIYGDDRDKAQGDSESSTRVKREPGSPERGAGDHKLDSGARRRDSPGRRRDSPGRRRDSPGRRRDSPERRRDSPGRRRDSPNRRRGSPGKKRRSRDRTPDRKRGSPERKRDRRSADRDSHRRDRHSPDRNRGSPDRKRDRKSPTVKQEQPKKLTAEEKAQRLREMQDNAVWRNAEREKNVRQYNKEVEEEERLFQASKDKDPTFVKELMVQHAENSSVEDRLKRNRYKVSRAGGGGDRPFVKS